MVSCKQTLPGHDSTESFLALTSALFLAPKPKLFLRQEQKTEVTSFAVFLFPCHTKRAQRGKETLKRKITASHRDVLIWYACSDLDYHVIEMIWSDLVCIWISIENQSHDSLRDGQWKTINLPFWRRGRIFLSLQIERRKGIFLFFFFFFFVIQISLDFKFFAILLKSVWYTKRVRKKKKTKQKLGFWISVRDLFC